MSEVFVARVGEIAPNHCRVVQVGDKPVAVFFVDGQYFAITDYCSHRAGPLSEGKLEGRTVTCPWHYAKFDLETGRALCRPGVHPVATWEVVVENDEIRVRPKSLN
jgi:nitrite reductase/ring-hydroxylating ferredoxin subunit